MLCTLYISNDKQINYIANGPEDYILHNSTTDGYQPNSIADISYCIVIFVSVRQLVQLSTDLAAHSIEQLPSPHPAAAPISKSCQLITLIVLLYIPVYRISNDSSWASILSCADESGVITQLDVQDSYPVNRAIVGPV